MAIRFPHRSLRITRKGSPDTSGFTLIEILVVIVMIGIVMAIAVPAWNNFLNNRTLSSAQDQLFQSIRQAQVQSLKTHETWQASFQEANGIIQFAVHGLNQPPTWETSFPGIHIDTGETTLSTSPSGYRVQFNRVGRVNGQLGRLTLVADNNRSKRCVVVSTLMGLLRKGQERARPDAGGRFCY